MPAYTTSALVRGVLAKDSNTPDGTGAEMADSQIQAEIDAAQAEVDARLAGRYTTPFATAPPLVGSLTTDIAAYRANLRWRQSEDLTAEDPMVLRYAAAQALLKDLASGLADLPGIGSGDGNGDSGVATTRNPYAGSMFTLRDFSLGYGYRDQIGAMGGPGGW